MISIKKARKLIGSNTEGMTDQEVQMVIEDLNKLAIVAFDSWLKNINKK